MAKGFDRKINESLQTDRLNMTDFRFSHWILIEGIYGKFITNFFDSKMNQINLKISSFK